MIWAAFDACGKSNIVVLQGRQNSPSYIQTLTHNLLMFASTLQTSGFTNTTTRRSTSAARLASSVHR